MDSGADRTTAAAALDNDRCGSSTIPAMDAGSGKPTFVIGTE
jgi:hypothetical protein